MQTHPKAISFIAPVSHVPAPLKGVRLDLGGTGIQAWQALKIGYPRGSETTIMHQFQGPPNQGSEGHTGKSMTRIRILIEDAIDDIFFH
jgi:hypothetical protein